MAGTTLIPVPITIGTGRTGITTSPTDTGAPNRAVFGMVTNGSATISIDNVKSGDRNEESLRVEPTLRKGVGSVVILLEELNKQRTFADCGKREIPGNFGFEQPVVTDLRVCGRPAYGTVTTGGVTTLAANIGGKRRLAIVKPMLREEAGFTFVVSEETQNRLRNAGRLPAFLLPRCRMLL